MKGCVDLMNEQEIIRVEYVPLEQCRLWDDNYKLHDIGELITSFEIYGFKDPPKFEPKLNGGEGGLVEGNGRTEALNVMYLEGKEPPRGILLAEDGGWLVPVLFGVDAASEAAAEAYGITHNISTLGGGDYDMADHLRMWSAEFTSKVVELSEAGEIPVVYDGDDIQRMIEWSRLYETSDITEKKDEVVDEDYWPIVKIKLSPQEMEQWLDIKEKQGLENDSDVFRKLVLSKVGV